MTPKQVLNDVFGYPDFRDGQEPIINSVLSGKDTAAYMPTSMGKSICFQIPALIVDGLALVVSPLIALMSDQVDTLKKKGVKAELINSSLSEKEYSDIIGRLSKDEVKILYVAPERFGNDSFMTFVRSKKIGLLAVDESHCTPGDYYVNTDIGPVQFRILYEMFIRGAVMPKALSMSKDGEVSYKQITKVFKNPGKPLIKIRGYKAGWLETTEDHVWFTNRGEVMAKDITLDDKVITKGFSKERTTKSLTKSQLQLVIGSYLGDGGFEVLSQKSKTHRIKFQHSKAQFDYMMWKLDSIGFNGKIKEARGGYSNTQLFYGTTTAIILPDILTRLSRGTFRSKVSEWILDNIGPEALAVWYMDDGSSTFDKDGYVVGMQIHCNSFDEKGAKALAECLLSKFGIESSIRMSRKYFFLSINKEYSKKMVEIISPYIHENMAYKLGKNYDSSKSLNWVDTETPASEWPIDKIEKSKRIEEYLYDIEVEDNHNYFVFGKISEENGSGHTNTSYLIHNCLSQWGHDFRPDYMRLGDVREKLGNPPIIAVTATATKEVKKDIVERLKLKNYNEFCFGFARPNLISNVRTFYKLNNKEVGEQKIERLEELIEKYKTGIIYCSTRKSVDALYALLSMDYACVKYHAGMSDSEREKALELFMSGRADIAVCTNAFGMGVDKNNIRFVIHYEMPGSVEALTQETGRAGRDGKDSYTEVFYSGSDFFVQKFFVEGANPDIKVIRDVQDYLFEETDEGEKDLDKGIDKITDDIKSSLGIKNAISIGTAINILTKANYIEKFPVDSRKKGVRLIDKSGKDAKIDVGYLREKSDRDFKRLNEMDSFLKSKECNQVKILRYFGVKEKEVKPCGRCPACRGTSFRHFTVDIPKKPKITAAELKVESPSKGEEPAEIAPKKKTKKKKKD